MNITEDLKASADRAFELLEKKSPHQLAVELVELERKHSIALSALDKMQDQRDQLADQLKDATAQCGVIAEALREGRQHINGGQGIKCGLEFRDMFERIDAALAGKLPAPKQAGVRNDSHAPVHRVLPAQHR